MTEDTVLVGEHPGENWFTGEYEQIPAHMREAIVNYVAHRKMTGDFLRAVVCNNLVNAVGYADDTNRGLIPLYVRWFFNYAPSGCWGSPEKLAAWVVEAQK